MEVFSARLKWLRERKKLSQQALANHLGLSQSYYGKFELNKGEPNLETLSKLPPLLGESLDFMIGVTDYTEMLQVFANKYREAQEHVSILEMEITSIDIKMLSDGMDTEDDEISVNELKLEKLKKQLPLWQERRDLAKEKVLVLLSEIPLVKPDTYNQLERDATWLEELNNE